MSRIEKVGGARTPGDNYGLEIFCRHTTILEYKFHIFIVNLALLFNIRIYGPILSYTFFNDDFSKRKIVPFKGLNYDMIILPKIGNEYAETYET